MDEAGEIDAAEFTGHPDVGKDEIYVLSRLQKVCRFITVFSFQHLEPEGVESRTGNLPHGRIVLDHQHGAPVAEGMGDNRLIKRQTLRLIMRPRQKDADRRSRVRLALHFDMSVALLNETIDHAEAEPRALAAFLCGEERLEDFLEHFRRHAGSGIAHGNHDELTARSRSSILDHPVLYGDGQIAAIGHRVAGLEARTDVLAERPTHQFEKARHQAGYIDGRYLQCLTP